MAHMTERQREIKTRLDAGMGARDIAEELGITRNAVYQQIQRMRSHGDLPASYTPSGLPPREQWMTTMVRPGSLPDAELGNEFDAQGFVQAFLAKEQRKKQLVSELQAISRRLEDIASELA